MKQNKYVIPILILVMLLFHLVSCGNERDRVTLDGYNPGTDAQFFQTNNWYPYALIQETENGCFLYHNQFVYVYNREAGTTLPLCNKPNCLHDKETDSEKLKECVAYLEDLRSHDTVTLMLYKDSLYVCYPTTKGLSLEAKNPYTIVRLSCEGSSKEEIFTRDSIDFPILHRGYIYYISSKYKIDDKQKEMTTIASELKCYRIYIEDKKPKEEIFFAPDETMPGYTSMSAFGNYIFLSFDYSSGTVDYRYDIQKNIVEKFQPEKENPSRIIMFQGCLYMSFYDDNDPINSGKTLYRTNWKGNEAVPALTESYEEFQIQTDDQFLYVDNSTHKLLDDPNAELKVKVYDKDFNLIDEYTVPDSEIYSLGAPIGGTKYQYMIFDDEDAGEWGLYIWDKSEIGTLHGKPYTQQKVVYQDRR